MVKLIEHDKSLSSDYYKLIGAKKSDPIGEIKRKIMIAFKIYHPDHGGDREMFAKFLEAKEVLLDPVSKRVYDKTGLHKDEITKVAAEFAGVLAEMYQSGQRDQTIIFMTLQNKYTVDLQGDGVSGYGLKGQLGKLKFDKAAAESLIEDIEVDNFFMKIIIDKTERRIHEISQLIFQTEFNIKVIEAKLELISLLKFKKKQQMFMFNSSTSASTNSTSNYRFR